MVPLTSLDIYFCYCDEILYQKFVNIFSYQAVFNLKRYHSAWQRIKSPRSKFIRDNIRKILKDGLHDTNIIYDKLLQWQNIKPK